MIKSREFDDETWERLLVETYNQFERKYREREEKDILTRARNKLELTGAVVVAMVVSSLTIFLNFVIVNLILHL